MKTRNIKLVELLTLVLISFIIMGSPVFGQIPNPDADREVIVMFKSNTLVMREGVRKSSVEELTFVKPEILGVFNEHEVDQVRRAFPDFNREDTIRVTREGITVKSMDLSRVFVIRLPESQKRDDLISNLSSLPDVTFAEPNGMGSTRLIPNDEHFDDYQWSMRNVGQNGATPGADIKITDAWDIFTGSPNIIIGIVDGGRVWQDHPDLTGRVFGDFSTDINEHSTHVAGIAAAKGNNWDGSKWVGIAGVDWNAQINTQTIGDFPHEADAIRAAVNAGANVINNSWGQDNNIFSSIVADAFAYAYKSNVVSYNAMPETGHDEDYPNLYGQAVINVTATRNDDARGNYAFLRSYVDVAAPGGNWDGNILHDIISSVPRTTPYGLYAFGPGTSAATPHVAGIASLLKGYAQDVLLYTLYNDDIENIIKISADKVRTDLYTYDENGWNINVGYGRVNASRALGFLQPAYTLYHETALSGSWPSYADIYEVEFMGAEGLENGDYCAAYYTVTISEPLPVNSDLSGPVYAAKVWGRGVEPLGNVGWNEDNPNFGMGYTEATIAINNTHVDLKTGVYHVWEKEGPCNEDVGPEVGWYPTTLDNVRHAYTVIGIETPPVPQNVSVVNSGGNPLISWDPVGVDESDLVGYNVYRKIGTGSWECLTSSPQSETSYPDETIAVSNKFWGQWI